MYKILFICAGNVARSQMAEAFYNHFTNSSDAMSAGVLDFTPEKYGSPIKEVVEVMHEEGIDVSRNRVKLVTKDMVDMADEIYVLCPEEKVPEFVAKKGNVTSWEIEDPSGSSVENFRIIRDQVREKVKSLLAGNR